MSGGSSSTATCFGKIPSRGDFVKGAGQHRLINVLDRWVSLAMEHLSDNPRWKIAYDSACAVDFAFVGARSRLSVVGHLRPSNDSSGRRFPFIAAATVERDDSLMFRCVPAGMGYSFGSLARICESGVNGADVPQLLAELDTVDCAGNFEKAIQSDPLGNFVRRTTLGSLAGMLGFASCESLRRSILAIGLLMRPALGQGEVAISRDIYLPLPPDERNRNLVAAFWIYLVTAFFRKTDIEAQFIMERRTHSPKLLIGFNGSSSTTLLAALAPESMAEQVISLVDPEWIDEQPEVAGEYGIAKLSAYLEQPEITLEQGVKTFREIFLGE